MTAKRVLVTGASGFVGRNCLTPLVERGFEVHAIYRAHRLDVPVSWHRVDLLDPVHVESAVDEIRPSHLLHLAWYAEPGRYWTAPENLDWVQASLGLLRAVVRHGGRRVVTAGTCAEYEWRDGLCSENVTPIRPSTFYGICKNALREMTEAFAAEAGFSAAWGRIFFMYGPHEDTGRLAASVVNALLRGEQARCSEGRQVRDFSHVADVASALVALLDSDVEGPVNVGSGEAVEVREIARRLGEVIGRRELVQLGALPARPDDPRRIVADVRRLREEVGWRPRFDLVGGLSDMVDWWRAAIEAERRGEGNYTEGRDRMFGTMTVEDLAEEMRKHRQQP